MRHRGVQPQTNWLMPPMFTAGVTGPTGQTYAAAGPIVLAATTTPTIIDLSTICGTPAKAAVPQGNDDWNPNPLGHRLLMQADGDNIYFAFGDSVASLAAISPTVVTGVTGASYGASALSTFTQSGGTSGCAKLVKDALPLPIELPIGRPPPGTPTDNSDFGAGRYSPARYLAFVAGATSSGVFLRMWQGSD